MSDFDHFTTLRNLVLEQPELPLSPRQSDYEARLLSLAAEHAELAWFKDPLLKSSNPRFAYTDFDHGPARATVEGLFAFHKARSQGIRPVCVFEDITPHLMILIGSEWNLDPRAFIFFMRSYPQSRDWARHLHAEEDQAFGRHWQDPNCMSQYERKTHFHAPWSIRGEVVRLHGELESVSCIRRCKGTAGNTFGTVIRTCLMYYPAPDLGTTNISVCPSLELADQPADIFLVDPLPDSGSGIVDSQLIFESAESGTPILGSQHLPTGHRKLRIPLGLHWDLTDVVGTLLRFGPNGCLHDVLWILRSNASIDTADRLLYVLALSTWQACFSAIEDRIEQSSYTTLREVNKALDAELHGLRWQVRRLKKVAKFNASSDAAYHPSMAPVPHALTVQAALSGRGRVLYRELQNWTALVAEATQLDELLAHTFQIFLGSVTLQESQASMEQNKRSGLIATLAFFYAPLTLVTGIFGMNIAEINGSPINWSAVVITLLVVGIGTVAIYLATKARERGRTARLDNPSLGWTAYLPARLRRTHGLDGWKIYLGERWASGRQGRTWRWHPFHQSWRERNLLRTGGIPPAMQLRAKPGSGWDHAYEEHGHGSFEHVADGSR